MADIPALASWPAVSEPAGAALPPTAALGAEPATPGGAVRTGAEPAVELPTLAARPAAAGAPAGLAPGAADGLVIAPAPGESTLQLASSVIRRAEALAVIGDAVDIHGSSREFPLIRRRRASRVT